MSFEKIRCVISVVFKQVAEIGTSIVLLIILLFSCLVKRKEFWFFPIFVDLAATSPQFPVDPNIAGRRESKRQSIHDLRKVIPINSETLENESQESSEEGGKDNMETVLFWEIQKHSLKLKDF